MAGASVSSHVRGDQRYAWLGPSLLIANMRGELDGHDPLAGYYFREARHLSRLQLLVNDQPAWLCSDGQTCNSEMSFAFTYPEAETFGGGGSDAADDLIQRNRDGLAQRALDVRVVHRVGLRGLETTLDIANHATEPVNVRVAWAVEADFADIQEALGGNREQCAEIDVREEESTIAFRYCHPKLPLATEIRAGGAAAWTARDRRLETTLSLAPQATARTTLSVIAMDPGSVSQGDDLGERLKCVAEWRERLTTLEAPGDNATVAIISRAVEDLGSLALLEGEPDEWMSLQAGIPLYPALFGRDTITAGWQAAMFDQGEIIESGLTRLGRLQSDRVYEFRDEEPGRIPYQMRAGPVSRLELNPFGCSYADFASPLLFIIGLAHRWAWCGDRRELRRHWDHAKRILDWARDYGDRDGDGYLEYLTQSKQAPKNQGWKDSGRAILHDDGRTVDAPIATCDIQGYWFAAQQLMSVMSWVMGEKENAKALWRSAKDLKQRFARDWWMKPEGFIALALDADKRPVRSITSNVGQCLSTGIISDEHIPRVVGRLFAPDLFSGWGIRTLSNTHPSYNPLSYHLGTVWPVENSTIVLGLRRYGFDQRAQELSGALFDLARCYERGRIPECVGGYTRGEFPQPGAYPRANPIQTWNLSGFAMLLQSMLGLQPVAAAHLLVVDPVLPPSIPELIVRDLRLGSSRATLRFWREKSGRCYGEVLHKRGPFHLVHQPPVESLSAGVGDRMRALFDTVMHH